ncbi:MAG: NADH-quinone oxidoreductase subunit A [Gammaproteobacteria bacterium]|nr:NADH-quinone oxidoreductase subunit A [Gammaproteobacteria bacterium]
MTEGHDILPFLLYALTVAALLAVSLTAAWFIGAKARHGGARTLPFESGVVPAGDAEESRFSIEFYLIAMFFVIFDLETIFIIGWAVAFFELGWRGYIGAGVFIVILLIALVYEYRSGALDWGIKSRHARTPGYAQAGAGDTGGSG